MNSVFAEPDVYTTREVARAGGVPRGDVEWLVESGAVPTVNGFLAEDQALQALRILRGGAVGPAADRPVLGPARRGGRVQLMPFAASTLFHGGVVALIALLTAVGVRGTAQESAPPDHTRLVFLAIPGPGGGGGGGGLRRPEPAARAELKGRSGLRSPVRTERRKADKPKVERTPRPQPPAPVPVEKPADTRTTVPEAPVPPVVAPVAPAAQETKDQPGVVEAPPAAAPSQGPGNGGGSGTGQGTGMGEGRGTGVGAGEGGGTGGGPYRPGSGVTPPSLLREVKPQYTEEARRRGIEGDVVLEIVVRADGSVGDVNLLQRLGAGLDQRAVEAVRQWRFSPSRRFGKPVDVLVEVAVEFKLR
ncbi:MAG TPA: energy transducer TonB [Vicinamibacterales bacterium]|jgi:TonB family protein|nr:energy transducer TonB [Vicinamibacterales bacterium]